MSYTLRAVAVMGAALIVSGRASAQGLADPAYDPQIIAVGAADSGGTATPWDDSVAAFSNIVFAGIESTYALRTSDNTWSKRTALARAGGF